MSSSCRDPLERLRLQDEWPSGSWRAHEKALRLPRVARNVMTYLEFLEDIDAFGRPKAPEKPYGEAFLLPGRDDKRR
ncbi:hypothetical protein [Desulfosoma caldarium]|uniref:Uncharacterized protein n=1 Tax=Desulfosoma caldarium TaxID=610254 RepID=A0A3N1V074_9BACT|nr:hypothetical protein [Desulfosoma caldarium]ROQ93521.1 hypothetical protein EDC27_1544 [Desulfosoma caldarium]